VAVVIDETDVFHVRRRHLPGSPPMVPGRTSPAPPNEGASRPRADMLRAWTSWP
jgi:hypothetical protein